MIQELTSNLWIAVQISLVTFAYWGLVTFAYWGLVTFAYWGLVTFAYWGTRADTGTPSNVDRSTNKPAITLVINVALDTVFTQTCGFFNPKHHYTTADRRCNSAIIKLICPENGYFAAVTAPWLSRPDNMNIMTMQRSTVSDHNPDPYHDGLLIICCNTGVWFYWWANYCRVCTSLMVGMMTIKSQTTNE